MKWFVYKETERTLSQGAQKTPYGGEIKKQGSSVVKPKIPYNYLQTPPNPPPRSLEPSPTYGPNPWPEDPSWGHGGRWAPPTGPRTGGPWSSGPGVVP